MLPVLFSFGPIVIYSFGVSLFLMTLVASFLIWREARRRGLSEEKVLDVLFLSIILAILAGRAFFAYMHWSVFSPDLSRLFLFFKYPGISYEAAALAGGVATIVFAFGMGLEVFLIADIFSLAILPATALGFMGCYLDGCYANSTLLIVLTVASLAVGVILNLAAHRLIHAVGLGDYPRRYGIFFLAYLIFLLLSFLMLGASTEPLRAVYLVIILIASGIIAFRYGGLFSILARKLYDQLPKRSPHTN